MYYTITALLMLSEWKMLRLQPQLPIMFFQQRKERMIQYLQSIVTLVYKGCNEEILSNVPRHSSTLNHQHNSLDWVLAQI